MKKISLNDFLIILSNDVEDRKQLSSYPLKKVESDNVKSFNIKGKQIFSSNNSELKRSDYLTRLNTFFLNKIPLNSSAVAYRKEKSYLNFFEPHTSSYNFLRLDIKSFFHNISTDLVRDVFSSYFNDEYFFNDDEEKQTLIEAFVNLIFIDVSNKFSKSSLRGKEILPIGFETSPSVSNIIFRRFDILIQEFCSRNNILYTRYADDMLFSSSKEFKLIHSDRFLNEISYIISKGGFKLNLKKTISAINTISINGYVLENNNDGVCNFRISNKKTKIIEKILYSLDSGKDYSYVLKKYRGTFLNDNKILYRSKVLEFKRTYYKSQIINVLCGYRSYLISILLFNEKSDVLERKYIEKYSKLITKLEERIDKTNKH